MIRNDRTLRRGGGVALLYRNDFVLLESHLSSEPPLLPTSIPPIELLACRFFHHTLGVVLVIVVYRPPNSVPIFLFLSRLMTFSFLLLAVF